MNKLLLLTLIGGSLYWLSRQPQGRPRTEGEPHEPLDPEDEQALLDEALDESFPASDPPAVSPPKH